ncbi:hypothetical protein CKA27_14025 [Vibrio coralliilyticus]|uniref:oligosaccharide flippase family protein n=3 Tax=Vibrio coralliilyticus TaxID=190893 RepID=UPI000BAAA1EB|nr:oligosaccharide flippase family protein [Vibrio coralliilyticus]PAT67408.1 hypothetical protein CKA27_14025 [Vibrio coralliilyticus]
MRCSKLVSNLTANFAIQIINLGFPLLLQFYLVRTLDLAELGKWYLVTASISLVQLLVTFPHIHLVKEVAKGGNEEILGSSYIVSYVLSLMIFPLYYWNLINTVELELNLAIFSGLFFVTLPLASEFYFQGKLKNEIILKRKLLVKVAYILSVLSFVKEKDDFSFFFIISILFYSIEHLFNFVYILSRRVCIRVNICTCKNILAQSWSYIPFNASYNTLPHISIIVFSKFIEPEILAVYSIFMRIVNVTTTFITSSVTVLLPYTVSEQGKSLGFHKGLMLKLIISVATITAILLLEHPILKFFLSKDIDANLVTEFRVLLVYIVFHVVYNYFVFLKFISKSEIKVPIIYNVTQISLFLLIVGVSHLLNLTHFYAVSIVLSSLLSMFFLFVHMKFNGFDR